MITWNKNEDYLTAFDRQIKCWSKVRNELNGLRKPNQIVYTTKEDGSKGFAYYPRTFPVGDWKITNIVPHPDQKEDTYLYPYFIATDAKQIVDTWHEENGQYQYKVGQTFDYSYGLHYSSSETTLGCIRIAYLDDLLWLVNQLNQAGFPVDFQVTE